MKAREILRLNFDTLSTAHNLFFEEPCPRCGILIQKNGGCHHMVCGKCRHEFCWWCLGAYYDYNHTVNLYCPYRYLFLVLAISLVLLMFNQKLVYSSALVFSMEWVVFYNVTSFIIGNMFVMTGLFYVPICDNFFRMQKSYQADQSLHSRLKLLFYSLLFVILALFQSVSLYQGANYNITWRMMQIVFIEASCGMIIGVIVLSGMCFKYVYRKYKNSRSR